MVGNPEVGQKRASGKLRMRRPPAGAGLTENSCRLTSHPRFGRVFHSGSAQSTVILPLARYGDHLRPARICKAEPCSPSDDTTDTCPVVCDVHRECATWYLCQRALLFCCNVPLKPRTTISGTGERFGSYFVYLSRAFCTYLEGAVQTGYDVVKVVPRC
jgi:hypothetical protein